MKKIMILILSVMALSLILSGCGGGGGGHKNNGPEKGAAMTAEQIKTNAQAVYDVTGAVGTIDDALSSSSGSSGNESMSPVFKSSIIKAESGVGEWSPTQDAEGWYTADYSKTDEGYPWKGTAKMRYLSSTGTIEAELTRSTTASNNSTWTKTDSTSISKGSNGVWNGSIVSKDSFDSDVTSYEFKNLNTTNLCGEIKLFRGKTQVAEITITEGATQGTIHVSGWFKDGDTGEQVSVPGVEVPVPSDEDK